MIKPPQLSSLENLCKDYANNTLEIPCHDTHHDDRWCSTCEAKFSGVEWAMEQINLPALLQSFKESQESVKKLVKELEQAKYEAERTEDNDQDGIVYGLDLAVRIAKETLSKIQEGK